MTLVKLNKPSNKSFNNLLDDIFTTVPSVLRDDFIVPGFRNSTPVNVKETENDFVLEIAAAGFQKEDFKIHLDKNTLTVSAERKGTEENKNEKYIRREFKYSSFNRSFTIDENVDTENVVAKYVNGVLSLNLPKKKAVKTSSKEINIQS